MEQNELELVKRLVDRLEHLSADSIYAHRASGLRGSLLRYTERLEANQVLSDGEHDQLNQLLGYGFEILELAAKEVGARDE